MSSQQSQIIAKIVVTAIAALVMVPIALVILYVIFSGISAINWEFLTAAPRNGMTEGGIGPALLGTVLLTMGTAVADSVLAAWQQHHGTSGGRAHALIGREGVAVFIENAFSQAETTLTAQQNGSDLLSRYVKQLLEYVCIEQSPRLEEATGCQVMSTSMCTDPAAGWAMCFFKLRKDGVYDR